jgi:hypothetical protein
MGKLTLDWEASFDFDLIGISSHLPNYRLVFFLNEYLNFDLVRADKDVEITLNKENLKSSFAIYNYDNEEDYLSLSCINNKSDSGIFIPELKQTDYLLLIWGNYQNKDVSELNKLIGKIPQVLMSKVIDPESLKSKNNLLF